MARPHAVWRHGRVSSRWTPRPRTTKERSFAAAAFDGVAVADTDAMGRGWWAHTATVAGAGAAGRPPWLRRLSSRGLGSLEWPPAKLRPTFLKKYRQWMLEWNKMTFRREKLQNNKGRNAASNRSVSCFKPERKRFIQTDTFETINFKYYN